MCESSAGVYREEEHVRVLGAILAGVAAVLAGLGVMYGVLGLASPRPASLDEAFSSLGYWLMALILFAGATPFGVLAVFCEQVHRHLQAASSVPPWRSPAWRQAVGPS
jgi:hypothetical protein